MHYLYIVYCREYVKSLLEISFDFPLKAAKNPIGGPFWLIFKVWDFSRLSSGAFTSPEGVGVGKMTVRHPIQMDPEGIYYDIPKKLISLRKKDKSSQIIQEGELMKRELLTKAKEGDEAAIDTLKQRYRIRLFIHKGRKII